MLKSIRCVTLGTCVLILPLVQAQERQIYWTDAGKILRGNDNGVAYQEIISARIPSAIDIAEGRLYWADGVSFTVQRSSLEGTNSEVILSGIGAVTDMAVDPGNRKLFWLEFGVGKIWRANLDGSGLVALIEGLSRPTGLAIDLLAGKLYWVDEIAQKIQRANLDGTQVEDVLMVQGIIRDIALNVNEGKIYWLANSTRELKRANLDGSNIETVLSDIAPFTFALDTKNGKIYLADVVKIVRVNFDGTGWEELVPGFKIGATSLAVDLTRGKLYWIDRWPIKIQRADLDGTDMEDILFGVVPPRGIALDVENGKLYWTGFGELMRANLDGSSIEFIADVSCGIGELSAIELDLEDGKIYWISDTDCGPRLHRANLDGTNMQNLLGPSAPRALALDLNERKIYWTNAGSRKQSRAIYRANLDGSGAETLIDSLNSPSGIAIDPKSRKMYWTDFPESISRANFDDTDVEALITGLSSPFDIALDVQNGKMYWTERDSGKIRRANLDGTDIEDLFTGLSSPHRIALTFEALATKVDEDRKGLPTYFQLLQNYPNPFNAATTIPFDLSRPSEVTLQVFNLHGEEIATLINHKKLAAGRHKINWNTENLSSGIYFYHLRAKTFVETRKLILLK